MAAMHSRNQIISIAAILSGWLILGLAQTAVGQQETAEQFVERVKNAIKKDELGRAHSGINHALNLKPQSAEAPTFSPLKSIGTKGRDRRPLTSLLKRSNFNQISPKLTSCSHNV